MDALLQQIKAYKAEIEKDAANGTDAETFRIKYLGTKGLVKAVMGAMKSVAPEQRKEAGLLLNEFKTFAEQQWENLKAATVNNQQSTTNDIDLTLPGDDITIGSRHPISIVRSRIIEIFARLGFAVADGPEIDDDWHNFTALNLPENHPARDMQDTFYIERKDAGAATDWLLRTHTSNIQIREMQKGKLPLRIICPGRVYRNETISARAHCFFHQVEGLYVDENVSFADLKQTLYFFVQEMFGTGVQIRFRPSYFPFTEPSAEMDVTCTICGGSGCSLCKQTGWVEILGCGMVHPKVLEACGIDAEKYTGFAFGMGIERITQIRYNVNDLRLYSQNDVRFLQQFAAAL